MMELVEVDETKEPFDYLRLDAETLQKLQALEEEIDDYVGTVQGTVGKFLLRAKEILPHGLFIPWAEHKYGISRVTAWRYMQVAQGANYQELTASSGSTSNVSSTKHLEAFSPVQHGMGQSKVVAWNTPTEIVGEVEGMFGVIDVDPASNDKESPNVPATTLYTEEDDGLSQLWKGRVFLNPPYGREIGEWIEKLVQEYQEGNIEEAIALVPGRTDTLWFRSLFDYPLCFISGRVRFSDGDGAAPFPSVLVYMGHRIEDFVEGFKHRGPIVKRLVYER